MTSQRKDLNPKFNSHKLNQLLNQCSNQLSHNKLIRLSQLLPKFPMAT